MKKKKKESIISRKSDRQMKKLGKHIKDYLRHTIGLQAKIFELIRAIGYPKDNEDFIKLEEAVKLYRELEAETSKIVKQSEGYVEGYKEYLENLKKEEEKTDEGMVDNESNITEGKA